MKVKAKVKFHILPGGAVRIQTVQNMGTGCRKLVDQISRDLGVPVEETRQDTGDMYLAPQSVDPEQHIELDGENS